MYLLVFHFVGANRRSTARVLWPLSTAMTFVAIIRANLRLQIA